MTKEEFALRSATNWTKPEVVGKFFVIPVTAISTGHQEQAKGEYKYKKDISDTYDVILMALKATFERVIDKHTTPPGIPASWGMGLDNSPHTIFSNVFEKCMDKQTSKILKQNYSTLIRRHHSQIGMVASYE